MVAFLGAKGGFCANERFLRKLALKRLHAYTLIRNAHAYVCARACVYVCARNYIYKVVGSWFTD